MTGKVRFSGERDKRLPGPVRTMAQMGPAEREEMARRYRPPPPTPIIPKPDLICRSQDRHDVPVELMALKKVRESERAVLYLLDGGERWLPKSVILDSDEMDDGTAVLRVRGWFAAKERLA